MKLVAVLGDGNEMLLRQVNPSLVRAGRPSSKVFEPKPKDEGLLSVSMSSRRPPPDAFAFFVALPKCKSAGILGVTVAECQAEDLPCHDAPLATADDDPWDDPAHAVIDYNAVAAEEVEEKAVALHRAAMQRGHVFTPPPVPPSDR